MKQLVILAIALLSLASAYSQTYNLPKKSLFREAKILVNDTNFIKCTSLSIKLNDTVSFFNAKTKRREEYHLGELNYLMVKDGDFAGIGAAIGLCIGFFSTFTPNLKEESILKIVTASVTGSLIGFVIGGVAPRWNTYYVNDTNRRR